LWAKLGGKEADLSPDVIQRFEAYDWPGNIRELSNAIARQIALGDFEPAMQQLNQSGENPGLGSGSGSTSIAAMSSAATAGGAPFDSLDAIVRSGAPMTAARQKVIDEFERRYTTYMLSLHGGNVTRAAAASGIGRRYFQMVRAKR